MKKLTILLLGLFALTVTSCGPSYNEKVCDDLIEKYDDKGKLSSDDLAEAIRQCDAILDEYESQLDKVERLVKNKDEEAINLWDELEDGTMTEQLSKLGSILEQSDLKGDNKKALKALEKKAKNISKKEDKIETKVRRLKRRLDD